MFVHLPLLFGSSYVTRIVVGGREEEEEDVFGDDKVNPIMKVCAVDVCVVGCVAFTLRLRDVLFCFD